MITIQENLHLLSLSKARSDISAITNDMNQNTFILTKKGNPVAVLLSFKEYQRQQEMLEDIGDTIAGKVALQRKKTTKKSEYLSSEDMRKKVGL